MSLSTNLQGGHAILFNLMVGLPDTLNFLGGEDRIQNTKEPKSPWPCHVLHMNGILSYTQNTGCFFFTGTPLKS